MPYLIGQKPDSRNLVNFRATNFSIVIVRCGYSSRFRFTHEILSPRKKKTDDYYLLTWTHDERIHVLDGSLAHRTTLYRTFTESSGRGARKYKLKSMSFSTVTTTRWIPTKAVPRSIFSNRPKRETHLANSTCYLL